MPLRSSLPFNSRTSHSTARWHGTPKAVAQVAPPVVRTQGYNNAFPSLAGSSATASRKVADALLVANMEVGNMGDKLAVQHKSNSTVKDQLTLHTTTLLGLPDVSRKSVGKVLDAVEANFKEPEACYSTPKSLNFVGSKGNKLAITANNAAFCIMEDRIVNLLTRLDKVAVHGATKDKGHSTRRKALARAIWSFGNRLNNNKAALYVASSNWPTTKRSMLPIGRKRLAKCAHSAVQLTVSEAAISKHVSKERSTSTEAGRGKGKDKAVLDDEPSSARLNAVPKEGSAETKGSVEDILAALTKMPCGAIFVLGNDQDKALGATKKILEKQEEAVLHPGPSAERIVSLCYPFSSTP